MGCGVPPFGDPVSCVTDLGGGAAASISGDFFGAIAKDFAQAADGATEWLWGQVGSASVVALNSGPGRPTFYTYLGLVAGIALVVATGLFVIQIITAVLRQDGRALRKAVTGLLIAVLGAGFAVGLTVLLLAAVDALCNGVLQVALGQSMQELGNHLLGVGVQGAVTNPAGMLLLSLLVLISVVIVWAALMIRKLLIVVTAVFAPLANEVNPMVLLLKSGEMKPTPTPPNGWARSWSSTASSVKTDPSQPTTRQTLARTSVVQCTPSSTRENATSETAMAATAHIVTPIKRVPMT